MDTPPIAQALGSLTALTGGDESAAAHLMDLIYDELRALAGSLFQGNQAAQTLQPTALVHETYLKVSDRTGSQFADRAHFFAVCAIAMRGILADHARRRRAAKRGGDWGRVTLNGLESPSGPSPVDALALDEALTELASRSERQARLVEYRFFGGLSIDDAARVLGVSRSTAEQDWRMARAWLTVHLLRGAAV